MPFASLWAAVMADLKALVLGRAGVFQGHHFQGHRFLPQTSICLASNGSGQGMSVFFRTSCGPCVGVASSSGATWSVASFQAIKRFASTTVPDLGAFSRLAPLPARKNGSRSSDVEVWNVCFPSHLLASRYWVVRWQGWSKYHGFNPIVSHRPMTFPRCHTPQTRGSSRTVPYRTQARMERHAVAVFTAHGAHDPKKHFENTY